MDNCPALMAALKRSLYLSDCGSFSSFTNIYNKVTRRFGGESGTRADDGVVTVKERRKK